MTTPVTREQVSAALFAKLKTAAAFGYSSRRFQTWDQIASAQKPALFLVDTKESHSKQSLITPAVRIISYDAYIFTAAGQDPNATPITDLNALVDAVDPTSGGVLAPNDHGRQTLGGLVYDCYLDGQVDKVAGDLDGLGVAILPVKVLYMQP